MEKRRFLKRITTAFIALSIWTVPLAAQTRVSAPKNKYKVADDVKLGNDAAREIENKFPILPDADANNYVASVGERLVRSIPREFIHPTFDYRFKVVNASDLNAFALPGGPMYINRGMIEKARNEGEMAGVMAHEISHVALRHATAQATKQSSATSVLGQLGLILGGAILGGQTGAQLGALGAAAWMTKYSREYETQADMLGARIMADAGYDPRDLANVFRTIQGEGQRGAPEFLSSHPDPGNRFEKINREAQLLRVSPEPIRMTRDFERVQARLRSMPPAPTLAEIERGAAGAQNPTAGGRYSARVALPSSRTRSYSGLNWVTVRVPSNWRDFTSGDSAQFSPDGAFGEQGITHGAMIGIHQDRNTLETSSDNYVRGLLQGNPYLRATTNFSRTYVAGRQGYMITLSGRSPVTGRTEVVNVFTTQLRSGELFYAITVVPENEAYSYNNAFRNLLNSIRLRD